MMIVGPKKNVAFILYLPLVTTNADDWQTSPTLAAGDFKVAIDGATLANLATLPTNTPVASAWIKISLSADEMNGDFIAVQCIDQTSPKQWKDTGATIVTTASGIGLSAQPANLTQIDGVTTTDGAAILNLKKLNIVNSTGDAVVASSTGSNGNGINASGNGTGDGIKGTGGATGRGIHGLGGATSGGGFRAEAVGGGPGIHGVGIGANAGVVADGGATGHGIAATGGATSGDGINAIATTSGKGITAIGVAGEGILVTGGTAKDGLKVVGTTTGHGINAAGGATSGSGIAATGGGTGHGLAATSGAGATGDGINALAASTNGNGLSATGTGTANGILASGGAGAAGDGIEAAAGGGVPIRGNLTGNITGNLSGSAGSVTGAVGSVTGAVGSVTGAVGSVTGDVNGNVVGSVGSVVATVAANLVAILGTALTETAGYLAAGFKKLFNVATPTAQADNLPLNTDYTSARAGYLDNLNVGGLVASSAEATSIQNNTRAVRVVPEWLERPDAGDPNIAYRVELFLYDTVGNMEAPDAAPTLGVVNQAGMDRSANLDSATMTLISTGRYRSTYTVSSTHAMEELIFTFSVIEGGATRLYGNPTTVVDTTAVDFTAADRADLATVLERTNRIPDDPADESILEGKIAGVPDAIADEADYVDGHTKREIDRLLISESYGDTTDGPGATQFKDLTKTKVRATETADENGDRTVTLGDLS